MYGEHTVADVRFNVALMTAEFALEIVPQLLCIHQSTDVLGDGFTALCCALFDECPLLLTDRYADDALRHVTNFRYEVEGHCTGL